MDVLAVSTGLPLPADYLLFAAGSITALAGVLLVFLRPGERLHGALWPVLGMAVTLGLGYLPVSEADREERGHFRKMLEGFAPTYAAELSAMGHDRISVDTPADDPLYLRMIAAQQRWLAANPAVADIYTLRRDRAGGWAFVVDSETDYDRNGNFTGENEARTAIGERYEDDDVPEWHAALAGAVGFSDQPEADRWGTWISAAAPIYGPDGTVEAVLGVDYDAARFVAAVSRARTGTIGIVALAVVVLLAATVVNAVLRRALSQRLEHQRRLAEALAAADAASAAKSAFLANMSHEIRTPMTAILGYADLLADAETDAGERRECVDTIRRNGRHLLALINDILDLSKIEAGKFDLTPAPCDPMQILEEVASTLRVRAAEKGLVLQVRTDGRPIPRRLSADPTRLRQVFFNLIGNAVKFTDKGQVIAEMAWSEPALGVRVIDSGPGMSAEVLRKLFQPFTQGDTSTTRRHGGTGLGLTISRRLAQLMGGDIAVASEPGRGSTFTLTIRPDEVDPASLQHVPTFEATPASRATHTARDAATVGGPLGGCRLLLAEDCPDNQRLIEFVLRRAGATVEIVGTGRAAVDRVLSAGPGHFDVVLMDMQMPELDGYAATGELRRHGIRTPVVALTAHAMAGDRERCLAAGCDDYAVKPIDQRRLIAQVAASAATSRAASAAA